MWSTDLGTSLCTTGTGVRGCGGLKKLDKMPPLRLGSLTDCVRDIGVGGGGVLAVLVRRSDGLDDRKPRLGSRDEGFLCLVSQSTEHRAPGTVQHGVELCTCSILAPLSCGQR